MCTHYRTVPRATCLLDTTYGVLTTNFIDWRHEEKMKQVLSPSIWRLDLGYDHRQDSFRLRDTEY